MQGRIDAVGYRRCLVRRFPRLCLHPGSLPPNRPHPHEPSTACSAMCIHLLCRISLSGICLLSGLEWLEEPRGRRPSTDPALVNAQASVFSDQIEDRKPQAVKKMEAKLSSKFPVLQVSEGQVKLTMQSGLSGGANQEPNDHATSAATTKPHLKGPPTSKTLEKHCMAMIGMFPCQG